MTEYQKFLKSWTSARGITSYLGSDKPAFQRDWKGEKLSNVHSMAGEDINRAGEPFKKPESMGDEDINRAGAPFKKPKPISTNKATLDVLTNPDLLKQIGAFTNPKIANDKFILPTSRDKIYPWYRNTPKKVRTYLDDVTTKATKMATSPYDKDIYKGLIKFLRDYTKKNKNATNSDVWSYILSQGVIDTTSKVFGKYDGRDLDLLRSKNSPKQNILYNYMSDEYENNRKPYSYNRDEGFV